MSESRYANFGQVTGRIDSLSLKDVGDRAEALGKMVVRSGENRIHVDFWNPRNADVNYISQFFSQLQEGEYITVGGEVVEESWNDNLIRKIRAYVSKSKGITTCTVYGDTLDKKQKAVLRAEGDIMEIEASYNENGEPSVDIELGVFNLYNPETKKEDLSPAKAVYHEIKGYLDYLERNNDSVAYENELKNMMKNLQENPTKQNAIKMANRYRQYRDQMYNLSVLTVTAHGEVAEEIIEEVSKGDNISVGCYIYNKADSDEFGFSEGSISELRIKKYKGVNEKLEQDMSGVNAGDSLDTPFDEGFEDDLGGW